MGAQHTATSKGIGLASVWQQFVARPLPLCHYLVTGETSVCLPSSPKTKTSVFLPSPKTSASLPSPKISASLPSPKTRASLPPSNTSVNLSPVTNATWLSPVTCGLRSAMLGLGYWQRKQQSRLPQTSMCCSLQLPAGTRHRECSRRPRDSPAVDVDHALGADPVPYRESRVSLQQGLSSTGVAAVGHERMRTQRPVWDAAERVSLCVKAPT